MLHSVIIYRKRVQEAFSKTGFLPAEDSFLLREWARYLAILTCCYLEQSIKLILMDYIDKRAQPTVASYAIAELKYFQNPAVGKILELFGSFDRNWKTKLETVIIDQKKDAIDSILNLRNNAAHGGTQNASAGIVENYFKQIDKVIEHLYFTVNPPQH